MDIQIKISNQYTCIQLVLQFEKASLFEMKKDILDRNHIVSDENALDAINLKDFCRSFLRTAMKAADYKGPEFIKRYMVVLCQIFDSVDVDSRGVISWTDFTNYCIRLGRNRFRPPIKQAEVEYHQRMDLQPTLIVRKMCFVQSLQLLFCFDNELSIVRAIKYD